jgi:hypothetical protein
LLLLLLLLTKDVQLCPLHLNLEQMHPRQRMLLYQR